MSVSIFNSFFSFLPCSFWSFDRDWIEDTLDYLFLAMFLLAFIHPSNQPSVHRFVPLLQCFHMFTLSHPSWRPFQLLLSIRVCINHHSLGTLFNLNHEPWHCCRHDSSFIFWSLLFWHIDSFFPYFLLCVSSSKV